MSVHISWEPHGVGLCCSGEALADDLIEAMRQIQNDCRFDQLRYALMDFSPVQGLLLSDEELDVLIAMALGAAYSNAHIRLALVSSDEDGRSLCRRFMRSSPYLTRLFSDVAAARAWIGEGEMAPVPLDIQLQACVPGLPDVAFRY